jgi:ketosteroid isomerase-like protein
MSDQPANPLSPEDIAAIRSVNEVFGGLVVSQDFESLVNLYTEDVTFMPPNGQPVNGREDLLAWFQEFPRATQMDITVDSIDGEGGLAYVLGSYVMTIVPEGADPIQDQGKFIEIRKKQPDGSWPLAADIFNSNLSHE